MNNGREPHRTEALGAYVLGALDEPEARAVAEHLAFCADCRALADEFTMVSDALGEVPPEAFLEGLPADGDLVLRRALRRVRRERSARHRPRRLVPVAAAAVAVALALGGGILVGRGSGGPPVAVGPQPAWSTPPDARGVSVSAQNGGAKLDATIVPAQGWVGVDAWVVGIPAGQKCELVVMAKSGQVMVAGSWQVSVKAQDSGIRLYGSVLIPPDQVAGIAVRNTAGHVFVGATT